MYEFDGKEFGSLKDLAKDAGINEKTLTARIRRGMPVEQACQKTDLRCKYSMDQGAKKSIAQICRENEKDQDLIRNRLKYGYSFKDALNKPKKISRQGKPITVNGILYNSISSAIRKLNLQEKEGTIRSRLWNGMNPDEAFNMKFRD